jgi:hypothetical protein
VYAPQLGIASADGQHSTSSAAQRQRARSQQRADHTESSGDRAAGVGDHAEAPAAGLQLPRPTEPCAISPVLRRRVRSFIPN